MSDAVKPPARKLPISFRELPSPFGILLKNMGVAELTADWWSLHETVNEKWIFYCNQDPGVSIGVRGQMFPLAPGRLVLIPPGCRYHATVTGKVRHLFGHFEVRGFPPQAPAALAKPFLVPESPAQAVFTEVTTFPVAWLTLPTSMRLIQALAEGLHLLTRETLADHDRLASRLEPAYKLINEQFARPIANRELAAACGMAVNTFLRHFRTKAASTPAQALLARRVHAAAQRLIETDDGHAAIAVASGLSTRTYLSRVFKAHFGIGPGEYRRLNRSR